MPKDNWEFAYSNRNKIDNYLSYLKERYALEIRLYSIYRYDRHPEGDLWDCLFAQELDTSVFKAPWNR